MLHERDRRDRSPGISSGQTAEESPPGTAGSGGFTEDLLEHALARAGLSGPDRRLCQELVYGVLRWQAALDWLIARKTAGRAQRPMLQTLLRLGLYQIFWLDRIPDHAAVHETVELARKNGFAAQTGFVNAVLRGYAREAEPTEALLADLKRTQPYIAYSHPEWLVSRWRDRWGIEPTTALLEWNNSPPGTFARVNTLKARSEEVQDQWRQEGVEFEPVARCWLDENLMVEFKSHPPLAGMASFQAGLFYVQDPGTWLAVCEIGAQPGETILDYCAAPGGKLTGMAQQMQNQGRLVAHDTSKDRIQWIKENCGRLGVTCMEIAQPAELRGPFDRILVDAPCSNTGVMRRRLDLRWRIRPDEIQRLRTIQLELLDRVAPMLKPGGTLVYSTCSLEPEENEAVVKEFLGRESRFKLERERTLLPFVDGVDGAYVARLTG